MAAERYLALKVMMMPKDANPLPTALPGGVAGYSYATIFGGVLLSYIDQAGAIGARHAVVQAGGPLPYVVTVAMNRVEFKKPVLVGDVVRFMTSPTRIGRASITMHIAVEAERGRETLQVTEAEVVYVGVNREQPEGGPVSLLPGTET
jgi:acyl-CoA thioesterase YciA